ncbi:MAG: BON domain-containing protein [Cyanobacteriota bacterium]|nr:BON domain-containing protein [Cyanobacteriota bacterium]
MIKVTTFIFNSILIFGISACSNVAKTSADAPDSLNDEVENINTVEETLEDSENNTRQAQLNADIRAREQRNNWFGDEQKRADGDLQSEVRAKLEANIPRGKLTVKAENGKVFIVGTVPNQKEYETIEPLAKEIKGVQEVSIDVKVLPPNQ